MPAAPAEPSAQLLCVCLASVSALSHWLLRLRRGEARGSAGASVPRARWPEEALIQMRAASETLDATATQLRERLCGLHV